MSVTTTKAGMTLGEVIARSDPLDMMTALYEDAQAEIASLRAERVRLREAALFAVAEAELDAGWEEEGKWEYICSFCDMDWSSTNADAHTDDCPIGRLVRALTPEPAP